jgi:hypothetical protein
VSGVYTDSFLIFPPPGSSAFNAFGGQPSPGTPIFFVMQWQSSPGVPTGAFGPENVTNYL